VPDAIKMKPQVHAKTVVPPIARQAATNPIGKSELMPMNANTSPVGTIRIRKMEKTKKRTMKKRWKESNLTTEEKEVTRCTFEVEEEGQ